MTTEERITVHEILDLLRQQESLRGELRKTDDHWRQRMEEKTDKMMEAIDELKDGLSEVPQQITDAIAKCREQREEVTEPALIYVQEHAVVDKFLATTMGKVSLGVGLVGAIGGLVVGIISLV